MYISQELPVHSTFANCSIRTGWKAVLVACARPTPSNLASTFAPPSCWYSAHTKTENQLTVISTTDGPPMEKYFFFFFWYLLFIETRYAEADRSFATNKQSRQTSTVAHDERFKMTVILVVFFSFVILLFRVLLISGVTLSLRAPRLGVGRW